MDDHLMEVFFDVQSDLPRQGPGDLESTSKALKLCSGLPTEPHILDIGCGPGTQTMAIAEALSDSTITAIDIHEPYLKELQKRASSAGLEKRVLIKQCDMSKIPFTPGSFDLIWAEGSAYIMGVPNALIAWKPLLKKGSYIALTELVWLTESPPSKAADFFKEEYPSITNRESVISTIHEAGYQPLDNFTLPENAWWDDYYAPLAARLPFLENKYIGDEIAMPVIKLARKEIAIREKFGDSYGYEFFVAKNN